MPRNFKLSLLLCVLSQLSVVCSFHGCAFKNSANACQNQLTTTLVTKISDLKQNEQIHTARLCRKNCRTAIAVQFGASNVVASVSVTNAKTRWSEDVIRQKRERISTESSVESPSQSSTSASTSPGPFERAIKKPIGR